MRSCQLLLHLVPGDHQCHNVERPDAAGCVVMKHKRVVVNEMRQIVKLAGRMVVCSIVPCALY